MPHKFHPYPIVQVVKLFIFAVLFSLLFIFLSGRFGDMEYAIVTVIWLLCIFLALRAFISAQFQTIMLEDATITYLSGVLSRDRVILPYAKITEATFRQSIIQRMFGVGTLFVDSAGGSTVAIYLEDIRSDELEKIVKAINKKVDKNVS